MPGEGPLATPEAASPDPLLNRIRNREPLEPGLYLVATPIGNLEDITLRALRVLENVDRIACEDTRQTQKLLNAFGIRTSTLSCHEHNEAARAVELLELLQHGGRVAVVSDAGLPGISDPGARLTRAAIEAGVKVIPVPGANAALTALIASGLDASRFLFVGFLAAKAAARRSELSELSSALPEGEPSTLVFYEAPHRVLETLADVEREWGGAARVAVARELTKRHEEFLRGTVAEVRAELAARERVRGEIVLLVEARRLAAPPDKAEGTARAEGIAEQVMRLIESEGLDHRDALKRVAREHGLPKSQIYREVLRARRKAVSPQAR